MMSKLALLMSSARAFPPPVPLLPATIHFQAGKSFTTLPHSPYSGDPTTTNMTSAYRMGQGSGPFCLWET